MTHRRSTIPTDLPDLRTIVEEWQSAMLASQLAQTSISTEKPTQTSLDELMTVPLADAARLTDVRKTLSTVSASNLLGVSYVAQAPKRAFDTATASYRSWHVPRLFVTGVDRTLKTVDLETGDVDQLFQPHKAAILSFEQHPTRRRYILTSSMDASAALTDMITGQEVQRFTHAKFVVRCGFSPDGKWMATASYDRTIVLYEEESAPLVGADDAIDDEDDPELASEPQIRYRVRHTINLRSNPECVVFHPSGSHLIYTRRSSHLLYYVALTDGFAMSTKSFNPHPLDDHVSFSVLNLAIHPAGRIIACQTGDHAGHGGERILLYDVDPVEMGGRAERLACLWTGEAGDDYVLPRMAWLPDGSGIVWVPSLRQGVHPPADPRRPQHHNDDRPPDATRSSRQDPKQAQSSWRHSQRRAGERRHSGSDHRSRCRGPGRLARGKRWLRQHHSIHVVTSQRWWPLL